MKAFLIVVMSAILCTGNVQLFKEAKIQLDLPNPQWFLADRKDTGKMIAYIFKREPITDETGLKVIPNIGVIIETIDPNTDIVVYSAQKRILTQFEVKDMFVHGDTSKKIEFNFVNAVGYKSGYVDTKGRPHITYIIHAIHDDKGVQIIFDVTSSLFDQVDKEFKSTIKSITTY